MEAALCWYIENVDARLTLEQYGAIAQSVEGLKELKKSLSGQTVQRTITDREVEKGHKPVTDKEVQITPWYANLPRFLDMCASYLEFVKRVGDEFFVVMDEAPQRFGEGSGRTRARSLLRTAPPAATPTASPRRPKIDAKTAAVTRPLRVTPEVKALLCVECAAITMGCHYFT